MRAAPYLYSLLGATLMSAGFAANAATGVFYDPSNAASPTGKTIGYELFGTIGCPGRQLSDTPCPIPPADTDGDGVIDAKDKCPNTPAGRKVNADGCELDSDGDGVVDALDKCPGTPAGRTVNADGCELDSDGDGVVDGLDKCPGTPAGRKVNADGCEIDTDGDGLVDGVDKCPTVYAKTADGCPLVPGKLTLDGVNFDTDRAALSPEAQAKLDEAADTLSQWGNTKVEVSGHTDSRGSDAYNQVLSERRADRVRSYLIEKGIAADRMSIKGYGESQPVGDNATDAGRYQNRRVEITPLK